MSSFILSQLKGACQIYTKKVIGFSVLFPHTKCLSRLSLPEEKTHLSLKVY